MIRYAAAGHNDCGLKAINEFKLLVREAHKLKIEVQMFASFAWLGISVNIVIITFYSLSLSISGSISVQKLHRKASVQLLFLLLQMCH